MQDVAEISSGAELAAEELNEGGTKCQGTTSVVPQMHHYQPGL